jgi:hypothetical protein
VTEQIFAKRISSFAPAARPAVCFDTEDGRDALISSARSGDLLVFVGTRAEPTPLGERGRLLALVEFARMAVDTKDVIEESVLDPYDFRADGSLKWPKALPVLRAWRFVEPRLKLMDALTERLTFESASHAVRLDEGDARVVNAIPRTEIDLPSKPISDCLRILSNALAAGRPTTGPVPTAWTGLVSRNPDCEAWTYLLRFGRRDVWKIGHAQDVPGRLLEINSHVPHEVLGEQWTVVLQRRWSTSREAYAMEQRLFRELAEHRTEGERLRCPNPSCAPCGAPVR